MKCPRCEGLLVQDQSWNTYETLPMLPIWRCLNCGETLEEGILLNRQKVKHQALGISGRAA
ncbi:MAG: hypothetical protein KC643_04875 [Nitrospira sp.]|nr:hypothetical protein [Nitrospira sp.]MCB9711634.1 hypothetical protein [Nitrospiraceae bacterium]MDR4487685.1 hypothetical protein [Nitrospirales bacterium]